MATAYRQLLLCCSNFRHPWRSYGNRVRRRIGSLGIGEVVAAPASPWQNAYVERVIGSLRRELLDHAVILNERYLKRWLSSYLGYFHQ
ncbi:MAG: integrase core domain-containing protein [Proteobacteria bacterium]|nr:integrase core domain-containing protein [Pseudomonadota bacterium]